MQASAIDLFTRRTTATLIAVYQKQISPHKGFSCAHRVLQGGESCSQYIKQAILTHGLADALPLIRQRFQDCKVANQTLLASRKAWLAIASQDAEGEDNEPELPEQTEEGSPSEPASEQGRRIRGGRFGKQAVASNNPAPQTGDGNSNLDSACDTIDCAVFSCDALDASSLDCGALDCGSADCSGLDCGSLDCGGCGDFGSCS